MKIGILGTGGVGQALGSGFLRLGHEVRMGSRDANSEKARTWVAKAGSGASAGTFADAARFAEVAVLATLGTGTERALELAGPDVFAGKVVIDATNPPRLLVRNAEAIRGSFRLPGRTSAAVAAKGKSRESVQHRRP